MEISDEIKKNKNTRTKIMIIHIIIYTMVFAMIVTGLAFYTGKLTIKKEVIIGSFDGKIKLSFGKQNVGKIYTNEHYFSISFKPRDDSFIEFIKNGDMLIDETTDNKGNVSYLLYYEGYYFIVLEGNGGSLIIENAYCEIAEGNSFKYIPFLKPYEQIYFNAESEEHGDYVLWDDIMFADDYESLADFYEGINSEYLVEINDENKTIALRYYLDSYSEKAMRYDYIVILTCTEDRVEFSWKES